MVRNLGEKLLLVLAIPVCLAIAVACMPLVLASQLYDFLALRWYCWRQSCWTYLVCSPRRGWHEFIENNLAPAVPAGVRLVWATRSEPKSGPLRSIVAAGLGQGKPYLAHVEALRIRKRSLHNDLQSLKRHATIDEALRQGLREKLKAAVRELIT